MKNRRICFILTLFALLIPVNLFAWEGRVVYVSDGDSLEILKDGKEIKIRLSAVDCPEIGQPWGEKAKQFTFNMVHGRVVTVWPTDTDSYGRTVAFVFFNDKNLNRELLSAGLAWHYARYSRNPNLISLELRAREKKIGLWSSGHPIPPWEWREKHRLP